MNLQCFEAPPLAFQIWMSMIYQAQTQQLEYTHSHTERILDFILCSISEIFRLRPELLLAMFAVVLMWLDGVNQFTSPS